MAFKPIKFNYNGVRFSFLEEEQEAGVTLTTRDEQYRIYLSPWREAPLPLRRRRGFIEFDMGDHTVHYQVRPIGKHDHCITMALAQGYFATRHLNRLGELSCVTYHGPDMTAIHWLERDSRYDQPILVYMDKLGDSHGCR